MLSRFSGVVDAPAFGDRAHVRVSEADAAGAVAALTSALARAGIAAVTVRPTVASLEDVFISMLKGATK